MSTSPKIRQACAEWLAFAMLDLFPQVKLIKSTITEIYFRYEFELECPVHPELLPMLEERMKGLIKGDVSFEMVEMDYKAAKELFLYQKQPYLLKEIEPLKGETIPLVRLGQAWDILRGEIEPSFSREVAFKLLEARGDSRHLTVEGAVFESKDALKEFIKQRKEWEKGKKGEISQDLGFFQGDILLPKGVKVYRTLENYWYEVVSNEGILPIILGKNEDLSRVGRLVGEWKEGNSDLCTLFTSRDELLKDVTSCLQIIDKTFKIFDLNTKWILCKKGSFTVQTREWRQEVKCLVTALNKVGIAAQEEGSLPKIELKMYDFLGESWSGPFLSVEEVETSSTQSLAAKKTLVIKFSLLGSVKHLISLLVEKWGEEVLEKDFKSGRETGSEEFEKL